MTITVFFAIVLILFVVVTLLLGLCGAKPPEGIWVVIARVCTAWYFLHFLVILPLLGKFEKTLPLPESISNPVISVGGGPLPGSAFAKPMEKI